MVLGMPCKSLRSTEEHRASSSMWRWQAPELLEERCCNVRHQERARGCWEKGGLRSRTMESPVSRPPCCSKSCSRWQEPAYLSWSAVEELESKKSAACRGRWCLGRDEGCQKSRDQKTMRAMRMRPFPQAVGIVCWAPCTGGQSRIILVGLAPAGAGGAAPA